MNIVNNNLKITINPFGKLTFTNEIITPKFEPKEFKTIEYSEPLSTDLKYLEIDFESNQYSVPKTTA